MKKCMRCPKPATLHITEIHDAKAQVVHLCETCAQKYLSTVEVGGLLSDPDDEDETADELTAESEALQAEEEEMAVSPVCPSCGISFKQFRSVGRLGCPQCYTAFHDDLIPLLESIHQEVQHVGKCPPETSDSVLRHHEMVRLRNELKAAVEQERYEEAARLRDEIQSIEATAAATDSSESTS
ncbi:MAG: DNA helicase UvrBC [Planctomycetota bacterium]|nr:MAG: DNA helicase UvrBC [Planctomycetota bacterium]